MKIRTLPWLALLLLAFLVIVALLSVILTTPENRTYVIGWEPDPPDQIATNTGEPTGFAVELVREAARRRGIRLKWVKHRESSEAALRSKAVDLWPMMTITEERKRFFHMTDPYQENEFGLFVDANSAFMTAGDLKQQTICYDGLPFNGRLLGEHFPGSVHLWTPSLADAVRSVCIGDAQAFFEDHITVFSLLLSNPPCPGTPLRMLPMPTIKIQLGIGATRESAAAADAIREEIGVMSSDGSLRRIAGAWSHNASQEVASLLMLQQAKSHLRWYRIGFMAVAGLLVFASWSAAGYRRQRMKSQAYCRALGQAERNVRLVTDSLTEMVVAYDSDKNLTYANPGAEKVTGYGLAELQAAAPLSWIHPEDRPQVLALWQKVFEGQAVDQVIYRLVTKDGTVKWVAGSWGAVTDEAGRHVGIRGTCQDITERVVTERLLEETTLKFRTILEEITERKRAEEALWENQQRLVSIYNTVRDVIFHLAVEPDGQFRFVSVNAAFLRVTGLSLERVVGKTVNEVIPEPSLTMVLGKYRQAVEENTIVVWEETSDYPTGRLTGEVSVAPVFDNNGNCTHLVGSVHDVTERNRAEETLRRNLDEIAHLNRVAALGEMVTSLAHELNQPLAAILTNAEAASQFLNRKSPNLARVRECLTAIAADDERAAEVIKRLRALLKKDQSQASLIDLNEVVSDALRLVNNDATLRETRVSIEPRPKLPPVLGDRVQLCQVVLNLLVNGLQAAAEQPPTERWVLVRTAEVDGGGVELTVEDSGKGIAESNMAQVFEPFFTTKLEGLGMGLSISQSIVQAHGGKIWADNSARHGAIFHCVLPVAQQGAAAATL